MKVLGITRPGPADVMTLMNAVCGAAAVLVVLSYAARPPADLAESGVRAATLLLLAGTIFDSLDGAFARGGRGTALGGMLDSLADALTFGFAPAVLLAQLGFVTASGPGRVLVVLGFLAYVSGALLRLADFSSSRQDDPAFTGLPSPLAAAAVVSLAFLTTSPLVIGIGLAALGLMMVSRLSYPKLRGPLVAAALAAWIGGILGTLGAFDMRIFAAVILLLIGLTPVLPALMPRERVHV
ncbi:phosphatidylcholine/phosphatidylserine synthase [Nocardioides sp.]|uniref:CDP-alcohol phosphatidyltransferase family protein n=1 Tax=Nocardioides sp. TaxID=35761 RepID=UPI00356A02D2